MKYKNLLTFLTILENTHFDGDVGVVGKRKLGTLVPIKTSLLFRLWSWEKLTNFLNLIF